MKGHNYKVGDDVIVCQWSEPFHCGPRISLFFRGKVTRVTKTIVEVESLLSGKMRQFRGQEILSRISPFSEELFRKTQLIVEKQNHITRSSGLVDVCSSALHRFCSKGTSHMPSLETSCRIEDLLKELKHEIIKEGDDEIRQFFEAKEK